MRMDNRSGQTLLEFLLSASLLTVTISGVGWMLRAEWDRARCAYFVFETTHATLTGRALPRVSTEVRIRDGTTEVSGEARCGSARQEVRLPKLEELK